MNKEAKNIVTAWRWKGLFTFLKDIAWKHSPKYTIKRETNWLKEKIFYEITAEEDILAQIERRVKELAL